jgi:hypothetical protein
MATPQNFHATVTAALGNSTADSAEELAAQRELYKAELAYKIEAGKNDVAMAGQAVADNTSARNAYVSIQESSKASRLAKNIQPVIAIITIASAVISPYLALFADHMSETSRQMLGSGLSGIQQFAMLVLGFYFGTSVRDKEHDKTLLAAQVPENK